MPYVRYRKCPLLTSHGLVLATLYREGPMTRRDLSEILTLSPKYVSQLLAELRLEGLVEVEGSMYALPPDTDLGSTLLLNPESL